MGINNVFFKKQVFDRATIKKYFTKAKSNLRIASASNQPEVKFHFSYLALIQIGITLMATIDYRVKSKDGHHVVIIENLAEILHDKDIDVMGNLMRRKRNSDIYGETTNITSKESKECQIFVDGVLKSAEEYIFKQKHLL